VFSEREAPTATEEVPIPASLTQDGSVSVASLVFELGLARSATHARTLIDQGAVSLDGVRFTDPFGRAATWELKGKVLRVGKHQFRKLV
jgi:tyrosyl-tRNA synthetase